MEFDKRWFDEIFDPHMFRLGSLLAELEDLELLLKQIEEKLND